MARGFIPLLAKPAEVAELLRVDGDRSWSPPVSTAGWDDGSRTVTVRGEKPGYREGMDAMTRSLVDSGMAPEKARAKAKECANRVHVRSENRGKY
mgnify:CR=1 FL=1